MKKYSIKKYNKKLKIIIIDKPINNVITDKILRVEGPLGKIEYCFKNQLSYDNKNLFIEAKHLNFFFNKVNNLFKSVTSGWFLELNLNGLGYKSFKLEDKIALDLGYSNLITYKPNEQIKIKNFKNKLTLFSIDQEYLYNIGFSIKNYSKPDAYKGKGILFKNEIVKLKKKAKT